jgi:hypothetical protein
MLAERCPPGLLGYVWGDTPMPKRPMLAMLARRLGCARASAALWRCGLVASIAALHFFAVPAFAASEFPYRSTDPGYPYPVYEDIAEEVLNLGLVADSGRDNGCVHNYFSWNPCLKSIKFWRAFAARHGLAEDHVSAKIFEAYVRRDYRLADKLYARVKGYELPPHGGYEGPGLEVLAFNLPPENNREQGCENNPYGGHPCEGIAEAWEAFAAKHGLPRNRMGATVFQAYVNGDFVKGDRLYASLTGTHTQYEIVHSGIGDEILALGIGISTTERDACDIDPYGFNPCNGAIRILREFAARHGMEVNRETAKLMSAYADGDYERGDTLYASAKGITVDQLLDQRQVPRKKKEREVPRLIIDIHVMLPIGPWSGAAFPTGLCG